MSLSAWIPFFIASWLISLSPGAGAISCMSIGMRHDFRRAAWNILGLQCGVFALLLVVATGLGTLLATSLWAFRLIKWAGVLYLIYLGIVQWRLPAATVEVAVRTPDLEGRWPIFVRAFMINASNPKGIVFMLAVLPQFIEPAQPQLVQYGICALTLFATDAVVMSGYTLFAARVLKSLSSASHGRTLNRIFGSLFIGAGLVLARFRH